MELEHDNITDLRGQAAKVIGLQRELRQMEDLHTDMEERIEQERQSKRFMEEERSKAVEDNDYLHQ